MTKLLVFFTTLVVILLASGWSCISSNSAPMVELSVVKQELTKDETGAMVANVTVQNTSYAVAELAEVTVDFYDADKNLVYSASDSVMNLNPNETWDFVIKCYGERCDEVASADIKATAGASSGGF